jgi:two-component system sensor histidine kinase VicK
MNAVIPKRAALLSAPQRGETLRYETLERYELLRAAPDPAIDAITQLAARACNSPIAAVAFPGIDRVWLYSRYGIHLSELPLTSSPVEATVLRDVPHEIQDARHHPAFAPGGIFLGGRAFRSYAGVPIVTPTGVRIGALFVLDLPARKLNSFQLSALGVLAHQVMTCIELNSLVRQMDRAARARQRVESALTVERNFVSTVLDTVDALVAVYDTAGRIVRFNRACETASGYDFPTLVGRYLWEKLIPEADVPAAIDHFEQLRANGFPVAFENEWRHRDGSLRRIAWSASALLDDQGQTSFVIATGIDVTIQRGAEATLRESEARYRQLVEGSLGMVCTHDLDGVLLSVNTHGAQSIGRDIDEMVGHSLTEFIPEERRASLPDYLRELTDHGEAQGLLYLCHVDSEVRVIAYRNKRIDLPGRAPYVLGFGVDITEQVRAEEKLRALIRQSNSVLESVGDGIFGIDLDGKVTVINPAASQMLGFKPNDILGSTMHELIHHTRADGSPYPLEECPISNTITNLDTIRVSNEVFWRKDGTSFPVEYVARPQIDVQTDDQADLQPDIQTDDQSDDPGNTPASPHLHGKAVGVVVAFTDTTERRALDRMKDEFISTVSHELRTPLTSLRAALGLVTGGTLASRPEKIRQMLDIATGNTDRLVRLVNDILELERIGSGKAELHYTMCSADDLFRRAAGLQQTGAAKAHIRITFNSHGVAVWADPDRVLQTLTNLISNAIKFSTPGGEIHLQARRLTEPGQPDVYSAENMAEILVRDQGRGIPEDKLESIFERFQQVDASDSRAMGGTGLGLAICRSIVAQHGGRIWATSTPGKGSTFHFTLPTKPASNLL